MNLNRQISEARKRLTTHEIARRLNCSQAMVSLSLNGQRNSDKAKEIRAYVRRLVGRNRMAA